MAMPSSWVLGLWLTLVDVSNSDHITQLKLSQRALSATHYKTSQAPWMICDAHLARLPPFRPPLLLFQLAHSILHQDFLSISWKYRTRPQVLCLKFLDIYMAHSLTSFKTAQILPSQLRVPWSPKITTHLQIQHSSLFSDLLCPPHTSLSRIPHVSFVQCLYKMQYRTDHLRGLQHTHLRLILGRCSAHFCCCLCRLAQ